MEALTLEASARPRFVVICDSRGNKFDLKPQPPGLSIIYVIRRGKTIEELTDLAFEKLKDYSSTQHFSFKFCAGINNFLSKEYFNDGSVAIRPSRLSPDRFIETLADIKSRVKCRFPNATVAFATIPSVSFEHIQSYRLDSGLLRSIKYSPHEIAEFQTVITQTLNRVNSEITEINKLERRWTIQWAEVIKKHHKKKCGRGNKNSTLTDSYHFDRLYDGLHAKSEIKNKWFLLVVKACRRETVLARASKTPTQRLSVPCQIAPNSDSDSDGEDDRCWKRKKISAS